MDQELEDKLMEAIWVIRYLVEGEEQPSLGSRVFTGVGIENGRILSCQHGFVEGATILGRRVTKDETHELDIVVSRIDWDLCIFKIKGKTPADFKSIKISQNEVLNVGEEIYLVSHGNDLVASVRTGRLMSPCIEVNRSTYSIDDEPVGKDEVSFIRPYAVMGYNRSGKYDPNLPMIECIGMESVPGTFGGPYIKNGEIVGINQSRRYQYISVGAHVSALKWLVEDADEKERSTATTS